MSDQYGRGPCLNKDYRLPPAVQKREDIERICRYLDEKQLKRVLEFAKSVTSIKT